MTKSAVTIVHVTEADNGRVDSLGGSFILFRILYHSRARFAPVALSVTKSAPRALIDETIRYHTCGSCVSFQAASPAPNVDTRHVLVAVGEMMV